jgi:hypothetical protein
MALVVADRVWETTSTSGIGTLTLSGAVSGYQTFAIIGNGNTTYYTITNGTDWEVGLGTYTSSGTTLSRDTVLSSSLGGTTKINVTPGSFVFVDYPASKAVYEDASDNVTGYSISGGTINGTTIGATTPSSVNATTITGQTGVLRGTGTNLVVRSQEFDNASWVKSNTTVTANATTAPDGTATADKIIASATTATHFLFQAVTSGTGILFQVSLYAKKGEYNFLRIENGNTGGGAYYNLNTGVVVSGTGATIVDAGSGWYRCSFSTTTTTTSFNCVFAPSVDGTTANFTGDGTSGIFLWGCQVEIGSTTNTYIPTTTTAVYGTPTLSFSGVAGLGLESNGSLYVSPAGTGALQAQATTSTTAGGNARGANAVDWQTLRNAASQVASGQLSFIGAGTRNTSSGTYAGVVAGYTNLASGFSCFVGSGNNNSASNTYTSITTGVSNTASGLWSTVVNGSSNTAAGYFNFIGNGFTNSGTSGSAVTTQSGTMNATTAVTLSGSNANIKVGQYITGTSIGDDTYVAAISGTALTLSKVASGSSTSTLSFFTPHGVVVGGGNNQATGSYSFIGGGGDAGTAANRNVASGDWSVVCGGIKNTASGVCSFVGGGGTNGSSTFPNTASSTGSSVVGGLQNTASGFGSFVGGGYSNTANSQYSAIMGGAAGTTRSILGNHVFPACIEPISGVGGVSQAALLVLGVQTTDATATALRTTTAAAGTTNQVILPNNSAYFFTGEVVSGVTGGGNTKGWTIEGVIKRGANAASTALVGTPTVTSTYADAGASTWVIAVTADTTNGGIRVTFTGQAATTIRTVCQIRTTEMTY